MINFTQLISSQLSRDSGKTAFIHKADTFSYQQLDRITGQISNQLDGCLEAYDLLALWLPNTAETIFTYLAAFRARLVPMPIHFGSTPTEISKILARSNARHIIVAKEAREILTGEEFSETQIEKVWYLDGSQLKLLFEYNTRPGSDTCPTSLDRSSGLILHTSGSCGLPKGVVLSRESLSRVIEDRVATAKICNDSFAVAASSLSHSVGLYQVLALLSQGAGFELLNGYDSNVMARSINEHHPTHLVMVVSAFNIILDHPDINENSFSNITFASVGADRVTRKVQNKFRALTGKSLSVSYGMTELSWILVNNEQDPDLCLALGKPTAGTCVELRDEKGICVPQGSVGEIFARSRKSMQGYLNQPAASDKVMGNGWIRSGDLACMDKNGIYWFAGRITDLIVLSSGDVVSPVEIEQEILAIPDISDCIVIGMQNDKLDSEVPWAFMKSDNAHFPFNNSSFVRKYLQNRLSEYKQPREIFFLDKLPTGISGKLSRKEMKQWCISNLSELDSYRASATSC